MAKESYTYKHPNGVFIYDHTNRKEILISDPSTDSKKLKSHVSRIHNKIKRDGDYKSPVGKVLIDTPHRVSVKEIKEGESKGSVRTHSDKKSSSSRSSSAKESKTQSKPSTSTMSKMKESFKKAIGKGGGTLGGGGSFGSRVPNKLLNPPYKKLYKGGVVNIVDAGKYFKHK